jgi:hypothetical protein
MPPLNINPISMASPEPQAPEPISMPTEGQGNVLPQTAESRATRVAVGLSAITGKAQPEIKDTIEKGKENDFRAEAAFRLDVYNQNLRIQGITDTIRKGQELPPEMLQNPKPTDPSTVFEKSFANAFAAPSFSDNNSAWIKYSSLGQAKKEIPQDVDNLHYFTKEVMAKDQYIRQKLEEVHDQVEGQSWIGWGWDQIKEAFQPYNEYKLRGNVEGVSKFAGGLLGNNLKAQADALLAEPTLDSFKPKLDAILQSLEGNPTLKAHFMQYIQQEEGPGWDNFWTGVMLAGAAGTSLKYVKLAKEITEQARDLAEVSKEVGGTGKFLPDVNISDDEARWGDEGPLVERLPNETQPAAQGDLAEAAVQSTVNDMKVDTGTVKNNPTKRAVEPIASAFRRLQQIDSGLHGQDLKNRINELLYSKYAKFMGLLKSQRRIDRIPDISQDENAVREVLEVSKRLYPELSAHVADVRGFLRDMTSNNWYAQMILTRADGQQFQDVQEAMAWAKEANVSLNIPGWEGLSKTKTPKGIARWVPAFGKRYPNTEWGGSYIEQQGGGFHIVKDIPIDETKPIIRQFYGKTKAGQAPWGPIRAFTSWISTPEASMSADQRAARLIATEGPSAFYKLAADSTEKMQKLSRSEADDLNRMLKAGQDMYNKDLQKPGYYFRSIGEYDDQFQRVIGRIPADHETEAYFEFRANMEMDYWLREASIIRNQARWGAQEWQAQIKGADGSLKGSPWFNARRVVDKFPRNKATSVARIGSAESKNTMAVSVHQANDFSKKEVEEIEQDMKTGKAKLLQIWDTDLHQLKGFGDISEKDRVEYVLSYNAKDRPLSWGKQLGRTEGGHLEKEYNGYLSQARVNKLKNGFAYTGDTNLFGIHNAEEGRRLAKIADQMREYKLTNDEAGAKALFDREGFPSGFKDMWEAFDESKAPDGTKIPPRLSTLEPIQYRPKDKMIMDLGRSALEDRYKERGGLIDGTKQGNPARSNAIQYTGERDAYDFFGARDVGTKYNPLFTLEKDDYIDAIPMMNRGLGRIINSIFMDDYKTSAVNHWLFGASVPSAADASKLVGAIEYLDVPSAKNSEQALRIIAQAPFAFFNNPKFKIGTPLAVKSALEADAMKIKAFIGVPSKIDTFLSNMEQQISDSLYGKLGPKALKLEPLWKLSALSDAPRFLRSIIFNTKMGFFSPRQFFIHAFTFINGALIAPRYAGSGAFGAMLHGWSSLSRDENILRALDEKASKFRFPGQSGWKPGEWREANEELLRSGFNHVDLNQLALKDNPMANNIIENKSGKFLDAGMSPFRAGVKSLKTASWYTAFKEFRDLHPTGPLKDADLDQILLRANDLSHNMSRASTSSIQKGMMTFGAMFSSYNLRLAELLIGKRLSGPEKARLFFGYMGIFGVPTAGGIFGLSTVLRSQVDKGNVPGLTEYVPGYDFASTAVMEGLLPILEHSVTGLPLHNWGESFGAKDLDVVDSALVGDKTMMSILGGAAYSEMGNTLENSKPLWHALGSMLRGDGQFTLTPSDAVQFLSEISTVSYARRAYMGATTGKWMSRNGAYLEPTSPENAIFSSILGLSSETAARVYDTSSLIKDRRAQEAESFKEYAGEMQKYFQALADNNPTQAQQFGKRAAWLLDSIPVTDKARAMSQAVRNNQPMVDRINWSATNDRSIPDADKQRTQNIYNKVQEMKQRNQ